MKAKAVKSTSSTRTSWLPLHLPISLTVSLSPLGQLLLLSNYHALVKSVNQHCCLLQIHKNPRRQNLLPAPNQLWCDGHCLCDCCDLSTISVLLLQQLLAFDFSCCQLYLLWIHQHSMTILTINPQPAKIR